MLNKEKIEKAKQNFKEEVDNEIKVYSLVSDYTQYKTDNHKIILEYIEQLETERQKLIDRIENEEICCRQYGNNRIVNTLQEEAKRQVEAYKQHILSMLKGENDE